MGDDDEPEWDSDGKAGNGIEGPNLSRLGPAAVLRYGANTVVAGGVAPNMSASKVSLRSMTIGDTIGRLDLISRASSGVSSSGDGGILKSDGPAGTTMRFVKGSGVFALIGSADFGPSGEDDLDLCEEGMGGTGGNPFQSGCFGRMRSISGRGGLCGVVALTPIAGTTPNSTPNPSNTLSRFKVTACVSSHSYSFFL